MFELGVELFREQILMRKGLREKLQNVLLRNMERERHSELIERDLMKTCLTMLVEVDPQTQQVIHSSDYFYWKIRGCNHHYSFDEFSRL